MEQRKKSRALLSVFRKDGLKELAEALLASGFELLSTGGTAGFLEESGLKVTPVESVTGTPEAFGGRMKTISFPIASAILFDRDNPEHHEEAVRLGLLPIDVVVCNFYPFERVLAENLSVLEAVELIDIGGPAMVRAAAKNFKHVVVLVDPADYAMARERLLSGNGFSSEDRVRLAAKAFQRTALYDAQIDAYFHRQIGEPIYPLRFGRGATLRYGENPHQNGMVFWSDLADPLSLEQFRKVSGKALSFNNFLDADGAISTLAALGGEKPACVIVKHANPCGAAVRETIEEAFECAWEGDPLAAYGGIVAVNRPITVELSEKLVSGNRFIEVLLAPQIGKEALEMLAGKKKNLRILINPALSSPFFSNEKEIKKIRGGMLVQDADVEVVQRSDLQVVSRRSPSEAEWCDLLFAWKIGKESRSNCVAIAREEKLVGIGVGQQDRLRACKLAVEKAGERAQGASAASDAFFPFPDGPRVLLEGGVTALIHPGGSIRDEETLRLCDEKGAALVTTRGQRAFKH